MWAFGSLSFCVGVYLSLFGLSCLLMLSKHRQTSRPARSCVSRPPTPLGVFSKVGVLPACMEILPAADGGAAGQTWPQP